MVLERRAALEKAQLEGKVQDYEGQQEEKAAQIIQDRWVSPRRVGPWMEPSTPLHEARVRNGWGGAVRTLHIHAFM